MSHIYLSLGTNLGNRLLNLELAVEALTGVMEITAVSPVYETAPWGPIADQPHYLNLCVAGRTRLAPELLITSIQQMEKRLGRKQTQRWGPHEIDIDLLFYDDLVLNYGSKVIPHGGTEKRAFVLVPLADIAADFVHPVLQKSVTEMLENVRTDGITVFEVNSSENYPAITQSRQSIEIYGS